MYWIFSVVFTFRHIDILDSSIRACYNNNRAARCIIQQLAADPGVPPAAFLAMLDSFLLVNVSTEHRPRALASFASIPVN